jgi:hypothetical protein
MPRKPDLTERVLVRLTKAEKAKVQRQAIKNDQSMQAWMRTTVKERLK